MAISLAELSGDPYRTMPEKKCQAAGLSNRRRARHHLEENPGLLRESDCRTNSSLELSDIFFSNLSKGESHGVAVAIEHHQFVYKVGMNNT